MIKAVTDKGNVLIIPGMQINKDKLVGCYHDLKKANTLDRSIAKHSPYATQIQYGLTEPQVREIYSHARIPSCMTDKQMLSIFWKVIRYKRLSKRRKPYGLRMIAHRWRLSSYVVQELKTHVLTNKLYDKGGVLYYAGKRICTYRVQPKV